MRLAIYFTSNKEVNKSRLSFEVNKNSLWAQNNISLKYRICSDAPNCKFGASLHMHCTAYWCPASQRGDACRHAAKQRNALHPMWMNLEYTCRNFTSRSMATPKWFYALCWAINVANSRSDLPFLSHNGTRKLVLCVILYVHCFDTIPACDRQTDRFTDKQRRHIPRIL